MNGLVFNDIPVPEEIIMLILSYTDTKTLLSCKLVCKEWNTLICSTHFWRTKLEHINKTTKKHLPWISNTGKLPLMVVMHGKRNPYQLELICYRKTYRTSMVKPVVLLRRT
ncbi:hypothetical protein CBL_12716 [Carabus blaptoides fortunei]